MRKVVDSNFLQSEGLIRYFAKSDQNFAVLTDSAAMEAYKGDTLRSIYRSMEILSQHPRQVIILKGTKAVCGLRGRQAGLQRRLIDERQTREFAEYCERLQASQQGNPSFRKQILAHGRAATAHMDAMIADAIGLPDAFGEIATNYTEAELRIIRNGSPFTEGIFDKLVRGVLFLAADLMKKHPQVTRLGVRQGSVRHLAAVKGTATGGQRNGYTDCQ